MTLEFETYHEVRLLILNPPNEINVGGIAKV